MFHKFANIEDNREFFNEGMMLLDIRQIIKAGETNTVEFKSWIKTPKYKNMIELLVKEG